MLENRQQFFWRIVCKINDLPESGTQPRVRVQKLFHLCRIPCYNDDQIIPMVFHLFQQCVHGFHSEIIAARSRSQCIRFINEQYASQCLLNHLFGANGGLSNIAADQSGTVGFDQMPFRENPQPSIDFREQTGNGCFPRSRISRKNHM